jgi:quinoprotein glucose dehydrogenase
MNSLLVFASTLRVAFSSCKKLLLFTLYLGISFQCAWSQFNHKTWMEYGSGPDNSKFVALNQITKSNVGQLAVAWSYPTRDNNSYLFNPIIVGNTMYLLARGNSLVALNATTGKEIWVHAHLPTIATRGINFWESKDHKDQRLIFQINFYIEEIDARTGKSILSFGKKGLVDLREGLGRDPNSVARIKSDTPGRVFENLILLGSSTGENYMAPPGDLRAYNVLTGKMVWSFHTVPHPGELGYDTWPKDAWKYAGGTNTWGEISLDEKRGIAYFPTGSSTYDMYGADRVGKDLFADCLLAINARTGKLLWYFQMVHHDLWDYDATAAPQLITVRHNGVMVDAVAQSTKQGFLYVFDRVTGKPLWPIEERPVPKSTVPGEQSWPTQPFPSEPPPFARQKLTAADVDPYFLSPAERTAWKERIANDNNQGLFTPPSSDKETVELPGARGGSNWGTTAANPSKGLVYLLTQDWPSFTPKVADRKLPRAGGQYGASTTGKQIYQSNCQVCHSVNRQGSAGVPSLVDIFSELNLDDFQHLVASGKGDMPAFPGLTAENTSALYAYLVNPSGQKLPSRAQPATPDLGGPVVASGGAPGGLVIPSNPAAQYGGFAGPPYPAGVNAPKRMYSDWKVPLGQDAQATAEGGKDTGVLEGGERRGIVVTSTGLLFVNAKDGKVRAYDADNGKVLWTATLPTGTEGLPSMYEVNGRQFLVVPAASAPTVGREESYGSTRGAANRAYVVYALPNKGNEDKGGN